MQPDDPLRDNEKQEKVINGIRQVRPKTENHKKYIELIEKKSITLCYGPAGTGKTSLSCGVAANLIKQQKFERIILVKPIIESSSSIGFLPGLLEEKISPYLEPLWQEFKNYIDKDLFRIWCHSNPKILQSIPVGFLRGYNFHNTIIIVDEAQNCSYEQLKLIITRLGNNSKLIINGDLKQSDLKDWQKGGFWSIIERLKHSHHVGIVKFHKEDVVRSGVLKDILELLDD